VSKARRPSAAAGGGAAAVSVSQLATSRSLAKDRSTPAFALARVREGALSWLLLSGGSSPSGAREAAALALATQHFVANGAEGR